MATRTNSNRYHNICLVVELMGEYETVTATDLAKRCNLSRQAILDILKQAKSWGWVKGDQYPYRRNVQAWVWTALPLGHDNAHWHMRAYRKAIEKKGQLPLL